MLAQSDYMKAAAQVYFASPSSELETFYAFPPSPRLRRTGQATQGTAGVGMVIDRHTVGNFVLESCQNAFAGVELIRHA
jgi:hypothetical protein